MISREIALTWFGQSGFLLESGAQRVVIDPFLTARDDRRYPPPASVVELLDTTLVICTHEHDDHLDLDFLKDLSDRGARPPVILPAAAAPLAAAGGLDPARILQARPGDPLEWGGVQVEPFAACHALGGSPPIRYGFAADGDPDGSVRFLGYAVEIGDVRVVHVGDTLLYPGLADTLAGLAPDVLLLPINGRDFMRDDFGWPGNMNEDEAAWLCDQVRPSYVIPMHWDAFANNLGSTGRFAQALGESAHTALLIPARGRRMRLAL